MNHDQQNVLAAYDDATQKLYATLFDQYAQAAGDPAQEQQADQNFKKGVVLAQRSRDRAVALVA